AMLTVSIPRPEEEHGEIMLPDVLEPDVRRLHRDEIEHVTRRRIGGGDRRQRRPHRRWLTLLLGLRAERGRREGDRDQQACMWTDHVCHRVENHEREEHRAVRRGSHYLRTMRAEMGS